VESIPFERSFSVNLKRKLSRPIQTPICDGVLVSSRLFPAGPDHFRKLDQWPAFRNLLAAQYLLCLERTPPDKVRWRRRAEKPPSYRIYVLKPPP
jgi:hypothetical protein